MEATSLRFAAAARTLGDVARRHGLIAPGFRSPPRTTGLDRAIRRQPSGAVVVAVRLKDRPWVAVLADMIDGVISANDLRGVEAASLRTELWRLVEADAVRDASPIGTRPVATLGTAQHPDMAA